MSIHAQNNSWVESTLSSMTLEEKVGQLFIADLVAVYSHKESPNFKLAQEFIQKYHVGGFVLAGGNISDIALMTNALQRIARTPLIINADLEGGLWFNHSYIWARGRAPELPRFVIGGGTSLPSLMAVGATGNPHFAYEFGRITALEARAVGIQWTNTPVADVNHNPNNPIINTRSFGEDPAQVAGMVEAYVRGMQELNVIATLKHFPGHGDTEEDTHMKLPVLPFDRARLDSVEFVPFRAGIKAGAKAVMTAHIALSNVDPV
jgi:beta-N-acetylhexosaminidase